MIVTIGDIHGLFSRLNDLLKQIDPKSDDIIIYLGDIGLFNRRKDWQKRLKKVLKKYDCTHYLIRGNHDNPSVFYKDDTMPNVKFINTPVVIPELKGIMIPGGVSIDQQYRIEGRDWWSNEEINERMVDAAIEANTVPIETIFSHVGPVPYNAPSPPSYVYRDPIALNCMENEKKVIGRILDKIQPKNWYYGHYHLSSITSINNTNCYCINELEARIIDRQADTFADPDNS